MNEMTACQNIKWPNLFQTLTFATLVIILATIPVILIYGPETDAFGGLVHILPDTVRPIKNI